MLSTPSYFKLKPQLRLAAEYDPSTYIEFELRCNLRCLNLRYRTVLPQFALGNSLRKSTSRTTSYVSFAPPFARRSSNHTWEYNNFCPRCTLYSVFDQSAIRHGDDLGHRVQEFTASITVGSIRLLATNLFTAGSATAARNRRACPLRTARPAFR